MIWIMEMNTSEHKCKDHEQLLESECYIKNGEKMVKGYIPWSNDSHAVVNVPIENVLITPAIKHNVISLNVIMEKGFKVKYQRNNCEIYRNEKLILKGERINDNYEISTNYHEKEKTNATHIDLEVKQNDVRTKNQENWKCITNESPDSKSVLKLIGEGKRLHKKTMDNEMNCLERNVLEEQEPKSDRVRGSKRIYSIKYSENGAVSKIIYVHQTPMFKGLIKEYRREFNRPVRIPIASDFTKCQTNNESPELPNNIKYQSSYVECKFLKVLKGFKVSKHFKGKEAFKGSTKTDEHCFKHKQSKHPQVNLHMLHPPIPLHEDTLYRGQLDNGFNMKKIKYKLKKLNSKIVRTYEHDIKLQPDEGSAGSDTVLMTKSLLKFDVTTHIICLNSELIPTSPSYGRKVAMVVNKCPEDKQESFEIFYLLHRGNSAKNEERLFANIYNQQPNTDEKTWQDQLSGQIWKKRDQFLCIQRLAIRDVILEEIMQSHLKNIKCKLKRILYILYLVGFGGNVNTIIPQYNSISVQFNESKLFNSSSYTDISEDVDIVKNCNVDPCESMMFTQRPVEPRRSAMTTLGIIADRPCLPYCTYLVNFMSRVSFRGSDGISANLSIYSRGVSYRVIARFGISCLDANSGCLGVIV